MLLGPRAVGFETKRERAAGSPRVRVPHLERFILDIVVALVNPAPRQARPRSHPGNSGAMGG